MSAGAGAGAAGVAAPGGAPGGALLRPIRLVALDLDGVVWRGDEVLPGVREALEDVLCRGLDLRYVSNNSTAHRATVSDRLAGLGLPAGTERVLTSGFLAGRWLRERLPEGAPVLVVGEEGLERELREAGLAPRRAGALAGAPGAAAPGAAAPGTALPKAVVVGMDRQFDYAGLAEAQAALLSGALFVATNRDATFPTPHGLKPGAGAIVAAVATAAEQEPVLLGKPGLALAEVLAAVTGVPAGGDPHRGRSAQHRHRHGQRGRDGHGAGADRSHQPRRPGGRAGGRRRVAAARLRSCRVGGVAGAAPSSGRLAALDSPPTLRYYPYRFSVLSGYGSTGSGSEWFFRRKRNTL